VNPSILLLLLFDGDGELEAVTPTLIGVWANVRTVEISNPRKVVESRHERHEIEARNTK
jgi:hypothetical protein